MTLVDIGTKKWQFSLVAFPEFKFKPSAIASKAHYGEEVDYRWLCFVFRVERYSRELAWPLPPK